MPLLQFHIEFLLSKEFLKKDIYYVPRYFNVISCNLPKIMKAVTIVFLLFRIIFTYVNVKWLVQGHTADKWQSHSANQAVRPCSAMLLSFLPLESDLLKVEVEHQI